MLILRQNNVDVDIVFIKEFSQCIESICGGGTHYRGAINASVGSDVTCRGARREYLTELPRTDAISHNSREGKEKKDCVDYNFIFGF